MHLSIHLLSLLPLLSTTFAQPTHLSYRDEASALALVSAYTEDNCDGLPFGDFVLDFETQDQCVGNGTIARGINVQKLAPGCVVNAFTFQDCTGEVYHLNQQGCWVQFTVHNMDLGVQGISVSCSASASASASASTAAAPSSSMASM